MPAKRMVFHAPFPVADGASSASGIRPWKMLQAFHQLGYEVFEITGYAHDRKKAFAKLKERMRSGWRPDFVYSEAATIPSSFTEPGHFPLILNLERDIFRFFRERAVPSGVFYRDVYWAFEDYKRRVGKPVAFAMRRLYVHELKTFNQYVDVLFLPSLGMADYVPATERMRKHALPPGSDGVKVSRHSESSRDAVMHLLYVGAIGGEHYDISELLRAVREVDDVELTICTRKDQWELASKAYADLLSDSVHVVHASGQELAPLYEAADIACLMMKPQEYRSFAAPMKLYEYLANGVPVLASKGTFAADVIGESGSGWIVGFSGQELTKTLKHLKSHPEEIAAKARNAREVGARNTWQNRAALVADTLATGLNNSDDEATHILMVPSWYPRNADDLNGSFFREQAEALVRSGFNVGVLALNPNPVYRWGLHPKRKARLAVENGVNVLRSDFKQYLPLQRSANIELAQDQTDEAFSAYVRQFGRPDVLHAHSLYPGAMVASRLSGENGIPYVYTEHRSLDHLPTRTPVGKRNEQRIVAEASERVAVSSGQARHLTRRFGERAGSWVVVPNLLPVAGEEDHTGAVGDGKSNVKGQFTYGHLSLLGNEKRVDLLIQAFSEVAKRTPGAKLLIGGDGANRARLEDLVAELGICGAVEFRGIIPRPQVADFLKEMDALVAPSESETMGVVLIEALAQGIPIITTGTWGGNDIAGGEEGIVVDIGDRRQLAESMIKIQDWPRDAETRRRRGKRCVNKYGEAAFVDKYARIYARAERKIA